MERPHRPFVRREPFSNDGLINFLIKVVFTTPLVVFWTIFFYTFEAPLYGWYLNFEIWSIIRKVLHPIVWDLIGDLKNSEYMIRVYTNHRLLYFYTYKETCSLLISFDCLIQTKSYYYYLQTGNYLDANIKHFWNWMINWVLSDKLGSDQIRELLGLFTETSRIINNLSLRQAMFLEEVVHIYKNLYTLSSWNFGHEKFLAIVWGCVLSYLNLKTIEMWCTR